jgi:Mrp family chromosome partitioning ATPase
MELARQLARLGQQVILLDWKMGGRGSIELGVPSSPGITDVLSGCATFEDVIESMPGSTAHVIGAGTNAAGTAAARERDRVSMLLDALDDAYDHVVITGAEPSLRDLFVTIEGRIDAGVVIARHDSHPAAGDFLGLSVAGLDILRYEPMQTGGRAPADLPAAREEVI